MADDPVSGGDSSIGAQETTLQVLKPARLVFTKYDTFGWKVLPMIKAFIPPFVEGKERWE